MKTNLKSITSVLSFAFLQKPLEIV